MADGSLSAVLQLVYTAVVAYSLSQLLSHCVALFFQTATSREYRKCSRVSSPLVRDCLVPQLLHHLIEGYVNDERRVRTGLLTRKRSQKEEQKEQEALLLHLFLPLCLLLHASTWTASWTSLQSVLELLCDYGAAAVRFERLERDLPLDSGKIPPNSDL